MYRHTANCRRDINGWQSFCLRPRIVMYMSNLNNSLAEAQKLDIIDTKDTTELCHYKISTFMP